MSKIIDEFQSFSKTTKWLIGGALVLVVVLVVSSFSGKSELDTWIKNYEKYRNKADSVLVIANQKGKEADHAVKVATNDSIRASTLAKKADHLQAQLTPALHSIDSLKNEVAKLKQNPDSVALARTVIPVQESIIHKQDSVIVAKDTIIATKDQQIVAVTASATNFHFAADAQKLRADSVSKILGDLPKAPKNPDKLLGIALPSRKLMFTIGGLIGLFGGAWAEHQLVK